jgi:microcin C transport system substrate-binding protein
VNVGTNNFDEIRYEYFRDDTVELEAFKADQIDWRSESTARVWATGYDFPAVRDKRVVLEMFEQPYHTAGLMLGFIFNLNRAPFDDIRVRQAFDLAFPYEDINKSLFYSQYVRLDSYFDGIPLAAEGLPEGASWNARGGPRPSLTPEVFTEVFTNPDNSTPANARANLRAALQLLEEAGYKLEGNRLLGPDGRQLTAEFLMNGPLYERIALRYQQELLPRLASASRSARSTPRSTRTASAAATSTSCTAAGRQSMSPGNEQIEYFGSASADRDGSRNYGGIKNPAVDALIRKIVTAPDRDDLVAATKALDRVLLWNRYLVPGWTLRAARVARWDRFGHPEPLPNTPLASRHLVVGRGEGRQGGGHRVTVTPVRPGSPGASLPASLGAGALYAGMKPWAWARDGAACTASRCSATSSTRPASPISTT